MSHLGAEDAMRRPPQVVAQSAWPRAGTRRLPSDWVGEQGRTAGPQSLYDRPRRQSTANSALASTGEGWASRPRLPTPPDIRFRIRRFTNSSRVSGAGREGSRVPCAVARRLRRPGACGLPLRCGHARRSTKRRAGLSVLPASRLRRNPPRRAEAPPPRRGLHLSHTVTAAGVSWQGTRTASALTSATSSS